MRHFWICWLSVFLCAPLAIAQDDAEKKSDDAAVEEKAAPDAEPADDQTDQDTPAEGSEDSSASKPDESPASKPDESTASAPDESPASAPDDTSALQTEQQKTSYAIGVSIGRGLKRDGADVDGELVARGLVDALGAGDVLLTPAQIKELVIAFQKAQREKFISEQAAEDAKQKPAGSVTNGASGGTQDGKKADTSAAKFLEENLKKEGVVARPSGLQYMILKEGDGPKPKATDTVKVHYRGTLVDGTEFDSSIGKDPIEFPLNNVVKGWTEGLQLMPVGSKWKLFLPPELGYGNAPRPGSGIKPGDALIFEVELLEIK